MSEKTPTNILRAAKLAAFTVGGGVALTFAMAGTASADEIVVQDADVTNVGIAAANSGGNVAIGNASQNTAVNGQAAVGLLASNNASASNTSNGTATIITGEANAVGNQSLTNVEQAHTSDDDGAGLSIVVQDTDVTNVGIAAANTGGNVAIGNASQNLAANGQLAVGGIASNNGGASNTSDGTASITTGAANATGNQSATNVKQAASTGDEPGLALLVQDTDVLNLGVAVANSGGNLGLGNVSGNLALNLQGAFGLIAANNGGASNSSNGSASIKTGNATATGNKSLTNVEQVIDADPDGLALVVQSAPVVNAGLGLANTGLNAGLGNGSLNSAILAQVSFGLLSSNIGGADNWSDGFVTLLTGNATGTGNDAVTNVKQDA